LDADQPLGIRVEPLGHSYKEFHITPNADGSHRLKTEALHIWPRESYMMIALPNVDGSFTATLFLPNAASGDSPGLASFAELQSIEAVDAFFRRDFASLIPVIPDFLPQFFAHQTSYLGTVRVAQWHRPGVVLIGDAAHAIVPFHGQGMNCAFEDALALAELATTAVDPGDALQATRQIHANAIADMAVENYLEMRDLVADPEFLALKQLERAIALRHPTLFVPRYSLVSFTTTPYAEAQARGVRQLALLERLRALGANAMTPDWVLIDREVFAWAST
jgi:kynurenine 3-monooxygenase